jgi:hypothetical protein
MCKRFGLYEGPNLGFSHRKLTWPLQQNLALPHWNVIEENMLHSITDLIRNGYRLFGNRQMYREHSGDMLPPVTDSYFHSLC